MTVSPLLSQLAERAFGRLVTAKAKISGHDESKLPPNADQETNAHSFGILLLEIISGRLPYSEEQGPLEKWVRFGMKPLSSNPFLKLLMYRMAF